MGRIPLLAKCVAAAGVLALFTGSLQAQPNLASTEELARKADIIAVGQVKDLASEWDGSKSRIRTRVTIAVSQFVKGAASANSLTLYVPGGEVDGVGEIYSHTPVFRPDENVLVFAAKDRENKYQVSGGVHGKFLILKDETTGQPVVSETMTLQQFTEQIKSLVSSQPAAEPAPAK